jgi:hypothetical protein
MRLEAVPSFVAQRPSMDILAHQIALERYINTDVFIKMLFT